MTNLTIYNSQVFMDKGFNVSAKMLLVYTFVRTGNLQRGTCIIQTI